MISTEELLTTPSTDPVLLGFINLKPLLPFSFLMATPIFHLPTLYVILTGTIIKSQSLNSIQLTSADSSVENVIAFEGSSVG
jgi:hypothetical protein